VASNVQGMPPWIFSRSLDFKIYFFGVFFIGKLFILGIFIEKAKERWI